MNNLEEIIYYKNDEELNILTEHLQNKIKSSKDNEVLRLNIVSEDNLTFAPRSKGVFKSHSNYFHIYLNKENLSKRTYSTNEHKIDIDPKTLDDLYNFTTFSPYHFNFDWKGILLPTEESIHKVKFPENTDIFDEEIEQILKEKLNVKGVSIKRKFSIEQNIIVNSQGGKAIQTIPYFQIEYYSLLGGVTTQRDISAICFSDDNLKKIPKLIKYLPDPTPSKDIKNSKNLSEAFENIYKTSRLVYKSREDAGLPDKGTYNVLLLNGVAIHEIFGHHFEEIIHKLNSIQTNVFTKGKNIENENIRVYDDPSTEAEGLKLPGYTNFDAYGRKRPKCIHIENGEVKEFLSGEYIDSENMKRYYNTDEKKAGNSTQKLNNFPMPRMSITCLDGKIKKLDEDPEIIAIGIGGETFKEQLFFGIDAEAYIIKEGEAKRIPGIIISGGIYQALKSIKLIDNQSIYTGICGKPDPINEKNESRVPTSQLTNDQLWKEVQVRISEYPDWAVYKN